jgi:hypothetical protein
VHSLVIYEALILPLRQPELETESESDGRNERQSVIIELIGSHEIETLPFNGFVPQSAKTAGEMGIASAIMSAEFQQAI